MEIAVYKKLGLAAGVAHVFDVLLDGSQYGLSAESWVFMKHYEGTLFDLVEQTNYNTAPIVMLGMARDISSALAHMHAREICHADIKPENVLYERMPARACRYNFVLCDMDLALVADAGGFVDGMSLCRGTEAYGAPEIWSKQQWFVPISAVTPRDVWSLGVVLAGCVTGRMLWQQATEDDVFYADARRRGMRAFLEERLGARLRVWLPLLEATVCVDPAARVSAAALHRAVEHLDVVWHAAGADHAST